MTDAPDIRTLADISTRVIPQAVALGLENVRFGDARATVRLPFDGRLVGDPDSGVIAGGAVTTLLDHTCGQAVLAALERYTSFATLDLRIDYMRPARPGAAVTAEAHCYRLTRSIAFVRAFAWDDAPGDPVATVQAAFMLDSNEGRPASGAPAAAP